MSRSGMFLVAAGTAALAGCVSAREPAPNELSTQMQVNPGQMQAGSRVYEYWCAPCHAAGSGHAGTMALAARLGKNSSVLLERTDLLDLYVKVVVRHGFRMMPPFKETEISDADLDAVAVYVANGGGKRPPASSAP